MTDCVSPEPAAPLGPARISDDGPPPAPDDGTFIYPEPPRTLGGCEVFPADTVFHADVRRLPVHPRSQEWINAYGAQAPFVLPTIPPSSDPFMQTRYGCPINLATSSTPRVHVEYNGVYAIERQYGGPFPKPPDLIIQDGFDQHTIVLETDECTSYELIGATNVFDVLRALGGARWELVSRRYNADLQAVTAPRLPLIGMRVRTDEVAAGRVDHPLAFVVPTTGRDVMWPATRSDGTNEQDDALPMGTWIRLKSSFSLDGLPPSVRVVAEALQVHGAVLADTGGVSGELVASIERGTFVDAAGNGIERELARIREFIVLGDFDVLDVLPMQASPDSLQIR